MDDPGYSWPSWKFGMKRGDLFTKLHDQYNTVSSTIQDPEAFHHDVYELSNEAATAAEFHKLMARRRQQRLDELNESLESAAVEIIANPELIGTDQWSLALQLFRSRSLDSLVRYFSSYLPEGYLDQHSSYHDASSTASSCSDAHSVRSVGTDVSSVDDLGGPSLFQDDEYLKPVVTSEPDSFHPSRLDTSVVKMTDRDFPPSPRSIDGSAAARNHDGFSNTRRERSLSFSGSESDRVSRPMDYYSSLDCREEEEELETSQSSSDDHDSMSSSASDSELDDHHSTTEHKFAVVDDDYEYEDFATAQMPGDIFDTLDYVVDSVESDGATPIAEVPATAAAVSSRPSMTTSSSYLTHRTPTKSSRRDYSASRDTTPKNSHPILPLDHRASPARLNWSPSSALATTAVASRRSPEEATSRISKPRPDSSRTRKAMVTTAASSHSKGMRRGLQ